MYIIEHLYYNNLFFSKYLMSFPKISQFQWVAEEIQTVHLTRHVLAVDVSILVMFKILADAMLIVDQLCIVLIALASLDLTEILMIIANKVCFLVVYFPFYIYISNRFFRSRFFNILK